MRDRLGFAKNMATDRPSVVFYYGEADQTESLLRFDVAVVEPGHRFPPPKGPFQNTHWLAYISVGEVLATTPYFDTIPQDWLIGRNNAWDARIIDQDAQGWPDFLAHRIGGPLWQCGYQGFFLDTLDSYFLLGDDPALRERQRLGLLRAIQGLRQAFPQAVIIMNRGFELLPQIHEHIDALAFESLYRGWDQSGHRYIDVSSDDRAWLLEQVAEARAYGLPVISIDYCSPQNARCAQETMERILGHDIVPYVGDNYLQTINLSSLPKLSVKGI